MATINLAGIRGRNGWDPPEALPEDMAVEVLNMDFYDGGIGRKRLGCTALSLTFSSGGPFATAIGSLIRFVPGASDAAAELWAFDVTNPVLIGRLAGGVTWVVPTQTFGCTDGLSVSAATLNGKLFLAYDATVNRLQVWDPANNRIRQVGLGRFAAAPTVANTGAGTYAATLRYYRARNLELRSGVEYRRSEPSASVSFTPSGTGTAARITQPTAIGEEETHWLIEVSLDNVTWYELAGATAIAIATTTYDDSAATTTYASGTAATAAGYYYLPPSARYLLSDGNRLLMAGAFETSATGVQTTPKNNRVWFTPVLDTTSATFFDDERVPQSLSDGTSIRSYIDLDENDGGFITGLAGPLNERVIVFKNRQVWALIPTANATRPYRRKRLTRAFGCIASKSIVEAEDDAGQPAIYFLSHDGPRRLGANGFQYLGYDIKDVWDTVNLGATTIIAHGVYDTDVKQIIWWVATGSANVPDTAIVFDVTEGRAITFVGGKPTTGDAVRYGWAKWTGVFAASYCSVMFSNTVGATMSKDLRPYCGRTGAANELIMKARVSGIAQDLGNNNQAYIESKPYVLDPTAHQQVVGAEMLVDVASAVTLQLTVNRDYGAETATFTSPALTQTASETKKFARFADCQLAEARALSFRLGDAAAANVLWTVDRLTVHLEPQGKVF